MKNEKVPKQNDTMKTPITPQIEESINQECEHIALYLKLQPYKELPEKRQEAIYHMALDNLGLKNDKVQH